MTDYFQYEKTIPIARKMLNASFVHLLKKVCGSVFHYHVTEVFADEDLGDYVYVYINDDDANETFKTWLNELLNKYGIGSEYVEFFESQTTGWYVNIYLSRKPKA